MEVFDFMKLFADGRKKTTKGIISIGVFDGVHKGHATLLEEMNLLKDQNPGSETFVITFNTNP
ncbi:MAG: FAD synthetase, partial [Spirochaetales bacterium]|nr:FAD synthetase [Candidatus Physcosoma equi]